MKKLIQTLWKIFLFSFPFSFSFVFYEKASYRFGNFSPWVTGFLFLPELLLFLTFGLWLVQQIRSRRLSKFKTPSWGLLLLLFFLLNAGLVTFFQGDIALYFFFLLRVLEGGMIYLLIQSEAIPHAQFLRWLLYGAAFQILIAYLQTRLNHSVGLYWIGEPHIGPQILNVAKTDLADGAKQIRPYGTLLHPNLLGAYLMTILLLSLSHLKKAALSFWVIFLSVGVYLTGSQAAQLTLLLSLALLFFFSLLELGKQKRSFSLGFLGLFFLGNALLYLKSSSLIWSRISWLQGSSIQERLMQNVISLKMFLNNLLGVGVGNFTLKMEQFSDLKLLPWNFQPVHNTHFLILNETGLQGLLLLIILIVYLLYRFWKKDWSYSLADKAKILPFFALIIIASFDHLVWTSWIGIVLVAMVVAETNSE